jgi:tungstate transport system substrate-binding protein
MKRSLRAASLACTALLLLLLFVPATGLAADKEFLLATTTSTDDTGLLDYLAPKFAEATGISFKWVATGTGKALKLGENCDADALLVHAPAAEKKFVEAGFGVNRRQTMYNDFVIIGPAPDPAGVKGGSLMDALAAIRGKQAFFISRGDDSGTHKMEISLWEKGAPPVPDKEQWYVQAGQGMLATINMAAERNGYTLTDRGTYIKYEADHQGNPPLKILVEKDALLLNQYSVIEVNPARCPQVKHDLAQQFSQWLAGPDGQKAVAEFLLMGKQVFTPNADAR